MNRHYSYPLLALVFAACGSSTPEPVSTPAAVPQAATPTPPAARPFDLVGTYDFTTEVQGQTVSGVMNFVKTDNVLGGKISTDMTGEFPVKSITLEGRKATVSADLPDGPLTFVLVFQDNDRFTGNWTLGDAMSGALAGKRKM